MFSEVAKSLVLGGISKGLRIPQAHLDRVNELVFLKNLLLQLRIDCVLDVGANRGQFAYELRRIGFNGLIISFEPVASEFLALSNRFKDDSNWRGYQIALGSVESSMNINVSKLTVMSSLLDSLSEEGSKKELIEVKRLDSIFPTLIHTSPISRTFLKMDTQGYDVEVFKGATGCMSKIFGVQSELSIQPLYKNMPHYLEALAAYETGGFVLHNLTVVNRIENGGLLEMNCFMRRKVDAA